MKKELKKGFKFLYVVISVWLTAYICSIFTQTGLSGWYNSFNKPELTPPNQVFPVIWTIIYILLILSTCIVLRDADSKHRNKINNMFITQLALQILWCFTFFAEGQLGLGLIIILLLDIVAFKTISEFMKVKHFAGLLLYPYYWWLIFATFLNITFVISGGMVILF